MSIPSQSFFTAHHWIITQILPIVHSSIIENINLAADNQMALHTTPGCMNVSPAPPGQRGMSGALDCSADSGCTVVETAPNSFGAGFNNAKGGVYATQFDLSG